MMPSKNAIDLIKSFEGLKLKAYQDPIGIWTIGYGTIQYPNGRKVRQGDIITEDHATEYLMHEVNLKSKGITAIVNQNQFDALVSFAYNLGTGALNRSTLLKKVKADPCDPTIRNEFMKWVNAGGRQLAGLVRRRKAEADLYFTL